MLRGQSKEGPFGEYYAQGMQEMAIKQGILSGTVRPSLPSNTEPWLSALIQEMWQTEPQLRPSFEECIARIRQRGPVQGFLRRREAESMQCRTVFEDSLEAVCCMADSGRGPIYGGCVNGFVKTYSPSSLVEVARERCHQDAVRAICCTEGMIWSGSVDGSLQCTQPQLEDKGGKRKSSFIQRMKHKSMERRQSKTLGSSRQEVVWVGYLRHRIIAVYSSGKLASYRADGTLCSQGSLGQSVSAACPSPEVR